MRSRGSAAGAAATPATVATLVPAAVERLAFSLRRDRRFEALGRTDTQHWARSARLPAAGGCERQLPGQCCGRQERPPPRFVKTCLGRVRRNFSSVIRKYSERIFSGCPYGDTTTRVSVRGWSQEMWFRPLLGGGCVNIAPSDPNRPMDETFHQNDPAPGSPRRHRTISIPISISLHNPLGRRTAGRKRI